MISELDRQSIYFFKKKKLITLIHSIFLVCSVQKKGEKYKWKKKGVRQLQGKLLAFVFAFNVLINKT